MRGDRRPSLLSHALLAVLAYVPIVLTQPGTVAADTKTYLYLDPSKLMARAASMWDPNVGMGTLTHQTIGYLFPMGPWYWLFDKLGFPDWLAQRLWLATVIFAAGAGVLFLCRTGSLLTSRRAAVVAALSYMLSPYLLDYSARISVILLPWAALPWLVGLADRALRRGGWRHPALFALVVLAVGGVNATALVFAGLGPVLWFPFAVWGTKDATFGKAVAAIARIGLLTTLLSVWWVMGLAVQGKFGIPILRYTETIETVARTSLSSEVLRGLGYWFFYGNDKLGPWIEPGDAYTQHVWLIVVSFAIPVLALAGAAIVRWRHRAYCLCLIVVGTVIAVGAHPYRTPSPLGAAFEALASTSTVGLALRSTPRAIPLVALGMALLLGAAVTAIASRLPRLGTVATIAAAVLVIAGLPPLFTGDVAVGEHIKRPEHLPDYWLQAASYLDAQPHDTRVLELPGTDFASYRWGNTIDPITPYLMERPYVARELIPYGSPASADLLNAFDRRLQEGVFEPSSLVPMARLMNAGDVLLRNDLQYERYRTPHPTVMAQALTPAPDGVSRLKTFGPPAGAAPTRRGVSLVDELDLGVRPSTPAPQAVAALGIGGVPPIVRTEPAGGETIVAGDGEGLVDLAAAGMLDDAGTFRYAASLTTPAQWSQALDQSSRLVLTDSNRLRARRWGTVRENMGFTEQPGAGVLVDDPTDARLDLFPTQTTASETVAQQRGVRSVRASRYGNPVSYTPEDRPANALDGDPSTAWRVGAFADVTGERLQVELSAPTVASMVRVVQPLTGPRNRSITRARLRFDGRDPIDVNLGPASQTEAGETLTFPEHRFSRLELEILDTSAGRRPKYDGLSGVGVAELDVAGARVDEVLRLPTDLLAAAGNGATAKDLDVVLTRQRSNPGDPARSDEEQTLKRTFSLPSARSFRVGGAVRIAATTPDEAIDALLGASGAVARSDARLPGDLAARASAALDGDPATAWSPGLLDQVGHWMEAELPAPATVDHLDLQVVADGRHSVPTRLRLEVDGEPVRFLDLPPVADGDHPGATAAVPLRFDAVTGRRFRIAVEDVRPVMTTDFFSDAPLELPVAIAELGLPGASVVAPAAAVTTPCRDDLLQIDGRPVPLRMTGTAAVAGERRDAFTVESCGGDLALGAGDHEVRSAPGAATTLDVDRLVLRSAAGGAAAPPVGPPAGATRTTPAVRVTAHTRTSFTVSARSTGTQPFWLVLGQSHNHGWHATVAGRDLGAPQLVDGFANGWLIHPDGGSVTIHLEWTPQRRVWIGLAVSGLALLLCLVILAASFLRSRRRSDTRNGAEPAPFLVSEADGPALVSPSARRPHLVTVAVVTVAFAFAAGPVVGVAAGIVTLLGVLSRPGRWLVAFGGAAALAAAGAYVALQQFRYRYPPDFAWPVNTERAHDLGWLAVALVVASCLFVRLAPDEGLKNH